jgi:hypothetical protein
MDKAREKLSLGKHEHGRDERGRSSKTQHKKRVPGRYAMQGHHGSAAPRSAHC